jgi:hypothetical protein
MNSDTPTTRLAHTVLEHGLQLDELVNPDIETTRTAHRYRR